MMQQNINWCLFRAGMYQVHSVTRAFCVLLEYRGKLSPIFSIISYIQGVQKKWDWVFALYLGLCLVLSSQNLGLQKNHTFPVLLHTETLWGILLRWEINLKSFKSDYCKRSQIIWEEENPDKLSGHRWSFKLN